MITSEAQTGYSTARRLSKKTLQNRRIQQRSRDRLFRSQGA